MEEKIIAKSESSKGNAPGFISIGIAVFLLVLGLITGGVDFLEGLFDDYIVFFILILFFTILAIFFFVWLSACKLVITDKRIYGKAAFGKSVNLPVDMISAVATGFFRSFSVSTSSGNITFYLLTNLEQINDAAMKLILQRQNVQKDVSTNVSAADELKKYKDLFDNGIITLEEFEAKKKELLNL